MSYVLAAVGFAALIVLHEAGHFAAAKAVGMRVERFALFFPPLIAKVRWGETEYGIGAIPLGGYVRISGMSPNEELPREVEHRAYFRQPPWKRIVVIVAGPLMNALIAFLILFSLFLANGVSQPTRTVAAIEKGSPAAHALKAGDKVVSVDGVHGGEQALAAAIASHHCAGRPADGCRAVAPAHVVVIRHGHRTALTITPRYDAKAHKMRLGFAFGVAHRAVGPVGAATRSGQVMRDVTTSTASAIGHIFTPQGRKQLSGVVGSYEVTQESFAFDATQAFYVLAVISLSLALVNLFPFLPLDGGHVFWAVAEKLRGKAIPFWVMERAGVVGFVLVAFLFIVGLTNDIGRLQGGGFGLR